MTTDPARSDVRYERRPETAEKAKCGVKAAECSDDAEYDIVYKEVTVPCCAVLRCCASVLARRCCPNLRSRWLLSTS